SVPAQPSTPGRRPTANRTLAPGSRRSRAGGPEPFPLGRPSACARMQEGAHLRGGRKSPDGPQQPPEPPGRRFVLRVTYVLAATELTCLFMQFSIMPYLVKNLGLDSAGFSYLQTVFGVLQLLGGPIFG
ncbi:solute carrier family 22 member 18-like, partial [Gracilinanus agilis]|uniref:solute carrier family 22 member 18-like n=1 Tax=Gracilinanus agilis TaxID=191870 RepID=UPI001CFD312B